MFLCPCLPVRVSRVPLAVTSEGDVVLNLMELDVETTPEA